MDETSSAKKGLIIVYTGNGKGKTTAALGQAMRAAGHGMKVCFIQFIKGSWHYGELDAVKRFEDTIDFHISGKGFTWKSDNLDEDRTIAQQGWQLAKAAIHSGKYNLVILDELTYLITYRFIDLQDVIKLLSEKPAPLHVVITGRNAPQELIETADLVTEMKAVKHPFKVGLKAQKGVEF
jgi:cob(I)alamin adenosyltransferase